MGKQRFIAGGIWRWKQKIYRLYKEANQYQQLFSNKVSKLPDDSSNELWEVITCQNDVLKPGLLGTWEQGLACAQQSQATALPSWNSWGVLRCASSVTITGSSTEIDDHGRAKNDNFTMAGGHLHYEVEQVADDFDVAVETSPLNFTHKSQLDFSGFP